MTDIQAFILGLLQGITEFLPVSSSTHLNFAKRLMGIESNEWMIYFDLMCHLGTLFAVLTVLWNDAWRVLKSVRLIALFSLALLPLVPAYFLLKPLRILWAADASFFLLFTSAFMFAASSSRLTAFSMASVDGPSRIISDKGPKWRDVLWIGIAQSLALLPGISRSASTISTARLLGWEWNDAARFSFLLAIPAIIGGSLIETTHAAHALADIPWRTCFLGFGASLIMGMGSVRLLFWMLKRGSLRPFAWYCLFVALISMLWIS